MMLTPSPERTSKIVKFCKWLVRRPGVVCWRIARRYKRKVIMAVQLKRPEICFGHVKDVAVEYVHQIVYFGPKEGRIASGRVLDWMIFVQIGDQDLPKRS